MDWNTFVGALQTDRAALEVLKSTAVSFMPKALAGGFIFLIFYLAASFTDALITRLLKAKNIEADIILLLKKLSRVVIIIIGVVTALGTMNVDVKALVAS